MRARHPSLSSPAMLSALARLVTFDTTSSKSNLECLHWIVEQALRHDARVRYTYNGDRSKANALISFGPDIAGGVLLSAHTDTVPVDGQAWSVPPFELTARNERLFGRGTCDMKGFIAACIAAFPIWGGARLERPIHLALSFDEELGCLGVPALIDDLVAHVPLPALVWVGEPTGMRIATAHKGVCVFETRFCGKAAHSSMPQLGHSAIADAVRFAAFLLDLGIDATHRTTCSTGLVPPHTTFNLGLLRGGTSLNTVASDCLLAWEFRPIPEEEVAQLKARIDEFVAGMRASQASTDAASAVIEHREVVFVPPLRPNGSQAAVATLRKLLSDAGLEESVAFGTEGGLFQGAGLPAVVCGPGSIAQAHQPDEWIESAQLKSCLAALCALPQHLTASRHG